MGAGPKQIAKLEAMQTKVAGLLHVADGQAGEMRKAQIALHDQANEKIAKLETLLQQDYPSVNPERARAYGKLLQQRKKLQGAILGDRQRAWEQGPEPAL